MILRINRRYDCLNGGVIPRSHFMAQSGKGAQIAIIQLYIETKNGVVTKHMTATRAELKKLLGISKGNIEIE